MDIFEHRYYRFGKILMSLTGQWPYHSIRVRLWIIGSTILFVTYPVIDQPLTIMKYWHDWDILMECFTPYLFEIVVGVKYFNSRLRSQQVLKLLDRIRTDWQVWARHQEVAIIHLYAERGKKISIVYGGKSGIAKSSWNLTKMHITVLRVAFVYFAVIVFMIQPMITKVIDIVLNNGTEPAKFAFPIAYDHVDVQKYYFYIVLHITACGLVLVTDMLSNEVMLILYVHHICGVFAAVGHTLEKIGGKIKKMSVKTGGSLDAIDKRDMVHITSCIDRHNDAIEYADLIKSTYAWDLFFTLGFGMCLINVVGLQMLLKTNDLGATLTFVGLTLVTLTVYYVECHVSQILIDHSINVCFYIQNSEWYRLLPKTQKILQFITMRCNTPCRLTAGNMLIMSIQTFGLTMRTTMSFFACFRSTQGI